MMMQCSCKAVKPYHHDMVLAYELCDECKRRGRWGVLQHIKCVCGKETSVEQGTDLAGEICQSCARQGNFTIQPF